VLAAGAGRRLRPKTDRLPKTLVPLDDGTTVLERILGNFAAVGVEHATVVVGYCGAAVRDRLADLERSSGLVVDLVDNPHGETRNNAYSLWCGRAALNGGAVLVNGDTLHPASVQQTLLAGADGRIALAVDTIKVLGDEEMKVDACDGRLTAIGKQLTPRSFGEYIGVAWIPAAASDALTDALERVWRRDADAFYEAAFQDMVERGAPIDVVPIGEVDWIEIDSLDDLAKANRLICHC
jgi:choline kinase